MTPSRGAWWSAATATAAVFLTVASAPAAVADPTDIVPPTPPGPPVGFGIEATPNDAAVTACSQFAEALDVAAVNYSDFADVTSGDQWSYADPEVSYANVTGRTALRQAAIAAAKAAGTPALQPEIADPMRSWSLHVTKLLIIMGVRGGNDVTNGAADQVNSDASAVQMACAAAGTQA